MLSPRSKRFQTPLPTSQVAVLMGVRLAEPTYTVIFPFINQMVEELRVTDNTDKIGFYSGLIESVFALVQFFTVYHWAKLSDRVGRRPVVLIGLLGVAISGSLFGLSTSFWMMLVFRSLSGALNGNVAVIKASLGDITDETNSTEAFAMYGLTWTVGAIIGNAIGGYLAHPVERFPELFGRIEIFKVHPYLLPCLVTASFTLIGILFALFVYRESLPSLQNVNPSTPRQAFPIRLQTSHKRNVSSISMDGSDTETLMNPASPAQDKLGSPIVRRDVQTPRNHQWGFWELISLKEVRIMSVTLFLNSFVGGAWGAASLLFFFDKNNGLSMSASAIGTALSLNGFWTITCQLVFLTRIRRALGISRAYKVLSFGWIPVWFILPHLRNVLERVETPISTVPLPGQVETIRYAETRSWTVSIAVNLLLSLVTFVGMANSLLMVLVNASAPDRSALGAVNGISTAVGCMARVIGPSLVSALFAVSMDGKVLGGRLWWIVMVAISTFNFITALWVAPEHAPTALSSITEVDEEQEELMFDAERDNWEDNSPPINNLASTPLAVTARVGLA